jgi:hypothetical protein
VTASEDGQRWKIWAEELGGRDFVSGNAYQLADGRWLFKPCEMPDEKVIDFLLGFAPAD